jgi:serine O-acetyltransferase
MNINTTPARRTQPKKQDIWACILEETSSQAGKEPILASFLHATILKHKTMEAALSFHLAQKLDSPTASALLLREVIEEALEASPEIREAIRADIMAISERDSACRSVATPFIYFKGYHALQSYRVAHWLWQQERKALALFFQNQISVEFGVDIHPAARLGKGIMLDHATGVVIGETAVVCDNVSIMQSVTLGGTGKEHGDRHPKVAAGVLIGAGAKVLGNIHIGEGAKIGPGSVVLQAVAPHTTVCGVPAKPVGTPQANEPARDMNHQIDCDRP